MKFLLVLVLVAVAASVPVKDRDGRFLVTVTKDVLHTPLLVSKPLVPVVIKKPIDTVVVNSVPVVSTVIVKKPVFPVMAVHPTVHVVKPVTLVKTHIVRPVVYSRFVVPRVKYVVA